jgi:hypothetical protein
MERTSCNLRTLEDLLGELERLLLHVEGAGDRIQQANTIVKIVQAAREIIVAHHLDTENVELRKLLLEHFPNLSERLRLS